MKYFLIAFSFLLPLHALIITFLKCKLGVDTDILRFWKEIIVILLSVISLIAVLKRYKFKLSKFFENNFLIGLAVTFAIVSFGYIFFPYMNPGIHSFLGYKYDVFFIFCLIIGFSLINIRDSYDYILKGVFASIGLILIIFLPWYMFGDISAISGIFGYSSEVSTYTANACISFSQNVEGQHRFQGTFGGPIRFSVFLIVWLFIYVGYILDKNFTKTNKIFLILLPLLFVFLAVFYSYSKTSILGFAVGIFLFFIISRKYIFEKKFTDKQARVIKFFPFVLMFTAGALVFVKRDLFLHLGSMINRLDNLKKAVEMFLYNPVGYGLGTAGPATQIGESIEAYSFKGAMNSPTVFKYLPENWYVQILIEQSYLGLAIFMSLLFVIGLSLFRILKAKKNFFSTGIFVSYLTLLFMANFTHAFEESATSYLLFLLMGAYIGKNYSIAIGKKTTK